MKKLVLLFVILITAQAGFCASDKMVALKKMNDSYKAQYQICLNVSRNFKLDSTMSIFIKNECVLYQVRRQKTLPLLFPLTSANGDEYKNNREILQSEYAIKMDKDFISNLKTIATDYCKANKYKYIKKKSDACTKIDSLFPDF